MLKDVHAVDRLLGEASARGRPGAAGLRRIWETFWSIAGAVPVRLKILGIALGMVLLFSLAIVVTLWLSLPGALVHAQVDGPGAVMAILTRDLLVVTAAASVVGIVSAYVLTVVLTRPILELVAAVSAVRQGDLRRTARVWARDEIGELASA